MEYTNDFISDVSEFVFKVGDKVITPYSECEVWKVTDKSVHVKHWDEKRGMWMFSKYLTEPWHYSQNHVSVLRHCC